jgi:hypothetical protein
MKKLTSVSDESPPLDREFHASFNIIKEARARHVKVRPHRSITPLKVTSYLLVQALLLPVIFCALVYWARPFIMEFWRTCIVFWSARIGLTFSLSNPMPSDLTMLLTLALVFIGFAVSLRMKNSSLPWKYPLRIICVVQLVTLVYFWAVGNQFPYSIGRHSEELMTIGYVVMLASPPMLAVGYYILNQSLIHKVFYTLLILGFFLVMVPHQILAQAFIMQHLSVLFMPVLYICMGAVFDALVFVALYSWVASNAPPNATT